MRVDCNIIFTKNTFTSLVNFHLCTNCRVRSLTCDILKDNFPFLGGCSIFAHVTLEYYVCCIVSIPISGNQVTNVISQIVKRHLLIHLSRSVMG